MRPRLAQLRLTEFKSFRDASAMRLDGMTVLIGRNSSGKSNALDGLEVLSRLATGADLLEALDSRRGDEGPLRGGIEGCPPHGTDRFRLGCTVASLDRAGSGYALIDLDVTVRVRPEPEIVSETLTGVSGRARNTKDPSSRIWHKLLTTRDPEPGSGSIDATWYRGTRGRGRVAPFRATRLLTAQLPLRLAQDTETERHVVQAAEDMLEALQGVFHLDPVPHLMRQYVPGRDVRLRRTGENLSAVIGQMAERDPDQFAQLVQLARDLVEHEVTGIEIVRSELNDVMLALREGRAITPAREMSDGLLRFMAIATTLITRGRDVDLGGMPDHERPVTVVIEELENGLHPSQAGKALELVRRAVKDDGAQVLFTTHSPALLSGLSAEDHKSVVVCSRDPETQESTLTPLPELDGYPRLMAQGDLGSVVTANLLSEERHSDFSEFDRLMGIG
ncbi:AAA family ATPase [Microbispora sp. H11081]|uniref:AAA family ATPase n=1 Tax=Microbispora sp. H11081 TaxID=2729107 RepID=UPI001472C100|nr:ATP-binding protein [Microbispora sp. H11081]